MSSLLLSSDMSWVDMWTLSVRLGDPGESPGALTRPETAHGGGLQGPESLNASEKRPATSSSSGTSCLRSQGNKIRHFITFNKSNNATAVIHSTSAIVRSVHFESEKCCATKSVDRSIVENRDYVPLHFCHYGFCKTYKTKWSFSGKVKYKPQFANGDHFWIINIFSWIAFMFVTFQVWNINSHLPT